MGGADVMRLMLRGSSWCIPSQRYIDAGIGSIAELFPQSNYAPAHCSLLPSASLHPLLYSSVLLGNPSLRQRVKVVKKKQRHDEH